MMPVLWQVRKELIKENNAEMEFIKGLIQDMQSKNQKISNPKESILDAVE